MKAVVSKTGRITIPKQLRDELGLLPGTVVEIKCEAGRLVLYEVNSDDPIERWRGRGKLPLGLTVDQYLDRLREMP